LRTADKGVLLVMTCHTGPWVWNASGSGQGQVAGPWEHGYEPSGSIKGG